MDNKLRKILGRIPPFLLSGVTFVAILWLTLSPRPFGSLETPLFPGADKIVHALMFGFLTLMLALDTYRKGKFHPLSPSLPTLFALASTILGILIEYLQKWLNSGRAFEYSDMVADGCGAFLSAALWLVLQSKWRI